VTRPCFTNARTQAMLCVATGLRSESGGGAAEGRALDDKHRIPESLLQRVHRRLSIANDLQKARSWILPLKQTWRRCTRPIPVEAVLAGYTQKTGTPVYLPLPDSVLRGWNGARDKSSVLTLGEATASSKGQWLHRNEPSTCFPDSSGSEGPCSPI
jgi:hypothetical protein